MATLVESVTSDPSISNIEFDHLRVAVISDSFRCDDCSVILRLNVRRKGSGKRGSIERWAVQGDRLDLKVFKFTIRRYISTRNVKYTYQVVLEANSIMEKHPRNAKLRSIFGMKYDTWEKDNHIREQEIIQRPQGCSRRIADTRSSLPHTISMI